MIRVMLVDDHDVVRLGLRRWLDGREEFQVVGDARDGLEAVQVYSECDPDVVLMDISMPVMDGIEATKRIVDHSPDARVVVLTSFFDEHLILRAIDAGALGYLLKESDLEDLRRGVLAAAGGESPLNPKAAKAVLAARANRQPSRPLSRREREVLVLLGSGLANKQIARRLGITEKTVKAHLSNVFRTIGVSDRTQAALWAERNGLLVDVTR